MRMCTGGFFFSSPTNTTDNLDNLEEVKFEIDSFYLNPEDVAENVVVLLISCLSRTYFLIRTTIIIQHTH